MKKALLLLVIASSVTTTTGCAHKKRVKTLEAEVMKCRDEYTRLRTSAVTPPPADAEFAAVHERD